MHHQGIAQLGGGLRVVARAEDGLPEAVELPLLPFVVGVQWHPEELAKTDQHSSSLFYDFVAAASSDWRQQTPADWPAHFQQLCPWHSPLASLANPAAWSQPSPITVTNGG